MNTQTEIQQADIRYPIGKFEPKEFTQERKDEWIGDITFLPRILEQAVHDLDEAQLHTVYRDGGWTVHQLVHHLADSHMNAFCRFKLGLTEDNPTIKPYLEDLWVRTDDVSTLPINISLTILHALHKRWEVLLKGIKDEEWERTVFHPEYKKTMKLWDLLGMYAWHGRHHTAHISALRDRKGW
jgi:hypothetical protein